MLLYLLTFIFTMTNPPATQTTAAQNKKALDELNLTLTHRQKFIKVHAAEYLIWTGHPQAPLKAFLQEDAQYHTEPKYRIVIWRVLAQAESNAAQKKKWLNNIYAAYKDMNGPDRTHATETLAKLQQPVTKLFPQETAKTLVADDRNLATYALWANSYGSKTRMDANREKLLNMALTDTNIIIRRISAYVLRKEQGLTLKQWKRLDEAALAMKKTDELYVTFLATALVTAPAGVSKEKLDQVDALITTDISHYSVGVRTELAQALAERGTRKHLDLLIGMLADKDSAGIYDPASDEGADLRAAAAFAILKINSRKN
ncbi:hypothetical protein HQ865_23585 [Mucilaginibacter mali]|uniref:HEAT repeat domain-containing protein n=1 Tax=Mucilaginibacter mali TaxID=2740462 RepID=A0A7D4TZY8_9SPHI|nr:hypothetical protein [Mucilaginibacter mali]QKJ32617.1 hypothetical protein HQ865_23585 [Mucilaginibacter mali]